MWRRRAVVVGGRGGGRAWRQAGPSDAAAAVVVRIARGCAARVGGRWLVRRSTRIAATRSRSLRGGERGGTNRRRASRGVITRRGIAGVADAAADLAERLDQSRGPEVGEPLGEISLPYKGRCGPPGLYPCPGSNTVLVTTSQKKRPPTGRRAPGLQPSELAAVAGTPEADPGLDPHDPAGEVGQDRGEGRVPREVHRLPAGRGGGAPPTVRRDSGADRPAASGGSLGVRLAVTDKAV